MVTIRVLDGDQIFPCRIMHIGLCRCESQKRTRILLYFVCYNSIIDDVDFYKGPQKGPHFNVV